MLHLKNLRKYTALFLTLSAASAMAEPVVIWPIPTPPPGLGIDAFPQPRGESLYMFRERLQEARRRPVNLIFDGDFITANFPARAKNLWQERYGALNVIDFGGPWERVENALWRLDHGQLDGLNPQLAVLMFGAADTNGYTPEQVAAGVKAAVDRYRQSCPDTHILLLGILPRGDTPKEPVRQRVAQTNQLLSKLADGKMVTFMDFGSKYLDTNGNLNKDLMFRTDDLTEAGYGVWADAIQPVIDQYCQKSHVPPVSTATGFGPQETWPQPTPLPGTIPTTFPVPRIGDWYARFEQNLTKLKDGPYDLVLDGDSITDNWQGPGRVVWTKDFANLKVMDIAIGGDQTQHVLWRVQHGDLDGQDPKLIELMIGTNNGGRNPADVCAGIRLILNEYEKRCPHSHILLLGVFPRGHQVKDRSTEWVAKINDGLAGFDGGRVTYMDIGSKFLEPDGTISPEMMPDFLHPATKGYWIWANAIRPVVEKYCGPNPGY